MNDLIFECDKSDWCCRLEIKPVDGKFEIEIIECESKGYEVCLNKEKVLELIKFCEMLIEKGLVE